MWSADVRESFLENRNFEMRLEVVPRQTKRGEGKSVPGGRNGMSKDWR